MSWLSIVCSHLYLRSRNQRPTGNSCSSYELFHSQDPKNYNRNKPKKLKISTKTHAANEFRFDTVLDKIGISTQRKYNSNKLSTDHKVIQNVMKKMYLAVPYNLFLHYSAPASISSSKQPQISSENEFMEPKISIGNNLDSLIVDIQRGHHV